MTAAPLVDRVRMRLAGSSGPLGMPELARQESALLVDSGALSELTRQLSAELEGAGPLEELLALPGVTDVLVNGPREVWLDRGSGLERSRVEFESDDAVRRLAIRLAAQAGRRLDDASPFVDSSLPDGTRLHAVLPPLVLRPTMSLRVLARRRLELADLVALQAMPDGIAHLLRVLVAARMTMLISGGTGSGKTTLLSALLSTVGPAERIITIEDAAELCIAHPHVVSLFARGANLEGAGGIGHRELVRQSLRMRADRIVVGEFRGAEIVELLAALNTGHDGGAATVHANSVQDVPARLIALASLGGQPPAVLQAQAASALDVLVHVRRAADGARRLDQIALWPRDGDSPLPGLVWSHASGQGPAAAVLKQRLTEQGLPIPIIPSGVA